MKIQLSEAIENSLDKFCRYDGVCAETGWKSMLSFTVITSKVKLMYDSVLLRLDKIGNVDGNIVSEDQFLIQ